MRRNNAHPAIDPRLERQYIETHVKPNEEAWPYDEPFPLDIELAKHYKDYLIDNTPDKPSQ